MTSSADKGDSAFLFRPSSFSLIYFTGEVGRRIEALLGSLGYAITGAANEDMPFAQAFDAIGGVEGPGNTIVYKAVYPVTGGTVLLDPEMTVGVARDDVLRKFCAGHGVEMFVVIWERFSQSTLARRITAEGVRTDVCIVDGKREGPLVNPPAELLASPGPDALIAFLSDAAAPVDEVFGMVRGWFLRLDEASIHAE